MASKREQDQNADIKPQPPYKQTINVVRKSTDEENGSNSKVEGRPVLCENPVHYSEQVYATRKMPCLHVFCNSCHNRHKTVIGGFISCLTCTKTCRPQDVEKITATKNKNTNCVGTKPKDNITENQKNVKEHCDYKSCQQKKVDASETILLACNHRFCHRCFFSKLRPEVYKEEYLCIKCANCENGGERWYTDNDIKPFLERNLQNYDFFKRLLTTKGSLINEIKCSIGQKKISLEFKMWKEKDSRIIKIWKSLKEIIHAEKTVLPDKNGLYKIDIPIEGNVYFFKISRSSGNVDFIDTKWFGPVVLNQAIPPRIEGEVKVENVSSDSVQLSWREVKGYKHITVDGCSIENRAEGNDKWEKCCFVKHPKNRHIVQGLKPKTRYTFRLIVVSSVGETESSQVAIETTSELGMTEGNKPNSPNELHIKFTDFNEGIFTWKEPTSVFTNRVLEYILEVKEENEAWKIASSIKSFSCTIPCPFNNMTEGKSYYFRILASNDYGRSKPCDLSHPVKKLVLNQPRNFHVEYNKDGFALLLWDTPFENTTTFRVNFLVEYKDIYSETWIEARTTKEHSIICPFTMMEKGTHYNFQVTAVKTECKSNPAILEYCLLKDQDGKIVKIQQKDKQESCHRCFEEKPLECVLSCHHAFCLDCSFKLFQNATEGYDGKNTVYFWVCGCDDKMTAESCVKFIGNVLTKSSLDQERKKLTPRPISDNHSLYDSNEDFTRKLRIRGLPNVGMSCYSNCIFQILAQTQDFCNHLEALMKDYDLDKNKSVTGLLLTVLLEINRVTGREVSNSVDYETVVRLMEKISQRDQSFDRGEQADSHSFMMALFNAIKEEIEHKEENITSKNDDHSFPPNTSEQISEDQKVKATKDSSTLSRDARGILLEKQTKVNKTVPLDQFEGYSANCFSFKPCNHLEVSERQMFNSLLIPIEKWYVRHWSVCKGLDALQNIETFNGKDLPCGECNNGQKKTSKCQIFKKLPEVLILQLGKFDTSYKSVQKMYGKVEYPHRIKLVECPDEHCEVEVEKNYRLYGVTLHSGSIYGGHYTAFVRCKTQNPDDAEWFYCSDSYLSKESETRVIDDRRASVLFYELVNERPINPQK